MIVVVPIIALLALVFASFGVQSRGPNATDSIGKVSSYETRSAGQTKSVELSDGHYALVTTTTVCRMFVYPDGRKMFYTCAEVNNLAGSTWFSGWRQAWNVPVDQGGHTDRIIDGCVYGGTSQCFGTMLDDVTRTNYANYTMNDSTTHWIEFTTEYPIYSGVFGCYRAFWNNAGDTSWSYCQ
jgi:hypothetical protein